MNHKTQEQPGSGIDLLEIARATGLRSFLHGVNATSARELLGDFVAELNKRAETVADAPRFGSQEVEDDARDAIAASRRTAGDARPAAESVECDSALRAEPAGQHDARLIGEILALASLGVSNGLTADDYCSQIVEKIKDAAPCAHCGRLRTDPEYCDWAECPAGGIESDARCRAEGGNTSGKIDYANTDATRMDAGDASGKESGNLSAGQAGQVANSDPQDSGVMPPFAAPASRQVISLGDSGELHREERTTGEPGWLLYDHAGKLVRALNRAECDLVDYSWQYGWMEGMQEGAKLATDDDLYRSGLKTGNDLCEATYATLLPYSYYMDPPDGGSVTIFEQMSRMAEDAAKWREIHDAGERAKYGTPLTWQRRCDWTSGEPAVKLMVEAMKAEIAELRAVLASGFREGRNTKPDSNESLAPNSAAAPAETSKDAVIEAARKLVKAKGRYHTELNYKALAVALDGIAAEGASK